MATISEPVKHDRIICGICHSEIKRAATLYQAGFHFGVVCSECYKNNSEEDIELMSHLFLAYGGHFGMIKDDNFSLYKVLKRLTREEMTIQQINVKFLHQALLHGVTPHQFVQGLRLMVKE
jgi:hypothetical protein